jgi:hypothetical protein
LYLATAFTEKQSRGLKLFPGSASSQSGRAANILKRVLKESEDEVLQIGYNLIDDIWGSTVHAKGLRPTLHRYQHPTLHRYQVAIARSYLPLR